MPEKASIGAARGQRMLKKEICFISCSMVATWPKRVQHAYKGRSMPKRGGVCLKVAEYY